MSNPGAMEVSLNWSDDYEKLRQQAAFAALQGLVARDAMPHPQQVAVLAVRIADALLIELAKKVPL